MRKLFVNGKIRTIDKDNHLVTAFAVEDGKFIAARHRRRSAQSGR